MPFHYRNWTVALRNRFAAQSVDETVTYALRSGARFRMQGGSHDVRVLNEVWLDRIYDARPDFPVQEGWIVLDVGAHKGSFTVRAALTGPATKVYAVEPEPENLRCLQANIAMNHLDNVVVHPAAIATTPGEALLYIAGALGSGGNSLFREHLAGDQAGSVSVPTLTLEDLLHAAGGRVDLMKMDIEGAEYPVLHAASPETLRRVRRLTLEYHGAAGLDAQEVGADLQRHLEANGFECTAARDRCLLYARRPTDR
jgi:FkbM family methyltransferase